MFRDTHIDGQTLQRRQHYPVKQGLDCIQVRVVVNTGCEWGGTLVCEQASSLGLSVLTEVLAL